MTNDRADDAAALPCGGMPPDASDRELFEARITAYALRQLDAAEAAEIERLLADPARSEARRQVDEIRRLAATIRYAPDETVSARSAALRRAVLAAATTARPAAVPDTTAWATPPASWRRAWPLFAVAGGLAAALLVAARVFIERPADQSIAMLGPSGQLEEQVSQERESVTEQRQLAATDSALETAKTLRAAEAIGDLASANQVEVLRVEQREKDRQATEGGGGGGLSYGQGGGTPLAAAAPGAPSGLKAAIDPGSRAASNRSSKPGQLRSKSLIDVESGSYAEVRRLLLDGRLPPRNAVRIEELVNSFRYDYPQPAGDAAFSVTVDGADCPWKPGHRLVRIGLQGRGAGMPEAIEDVTIQIDADPAQVGSCRLLGSEDEDRSLAVRDFRASGIGAGRSVTALYEIKLVRAEAVEPAARRDLLTVKLRWKRPGAEKSEELEMPLADRGPEFAEAPADLRFAAAVAAFGMILRGSDQRGEATLPFVAKIAADSLGRDEGGHRAEFLDLVRHAESAR